MYKCLTRRYQELIRWLLVLRAYVHIEYNSSNRNHVVLQTYAPYFSMSDICFAS